MLFYFLWVNGIHESKESINEELKDNDINPLTYKAPCILHK